MSTRTITVNGRDLTPETVASVAGQGRVTVSIDAAALERMNASRAVVDEAVENSAVIYGITTGFGEFANVSIPRPRLAELQANLIRSHAVGAGKEMPPEVVRAMILLRINALAVGCSGIRIETVRTLGQMLEHDILPVIPVQGSVGSSGDLVPLAHLVLGAMGEGEVVVSGQRLPARDALESVGVEPVRLEAKEGLALINGTQMMTAYGTLALVEFEHLLDAADIVSVLALEALRGTDRAFDPRLHAARPHPEQIRVARHLRGLMQESPIRESHRDDDDRVQDAYSLRCIPQVHGASRSTAAYVREVLTTEINSATDNPLIFSHEGEAIEGGNFHGQPVALPLDFLAIAASEIANISERRTERMVNGALSRLPRFLTDEGGINSGMMIAQYTAASIVSENKVLAHPASVDSIPTSANQEDHNSMGSIAARKARTVVDNVATVLAIEYLCACQGLDFHRPLQPGVRLRPFYDLLRAEVPRLAGDRYLKADLDTARKVLTSSAFRNLALETLGQIGD